MTILRTACLLLVIAGLIHLLIWKIQMPKRQILALNLILAGVLAGWCVGSAAVIWADESRSLDLAQFCALLHVALFYASIGLSYVITYSAIESDSPTLSLVRFIAEKQTGGRSADEVRRFLAERPFVGNRLAALVAAGLVAERDGQYVVTGRSGLGFRFILAFRKLYGALPRGG